MARAISPKEAIALNEPDQREVDAIIEKLNEKLRAYDGTRPIPVDAKLLGRGKVLQHVLGEFEAAGWVPTLRGDQREGDFYTFVHRP